MNFTPIAPLACLVLGIAVSGCTTAKSSSAKPGVQITKLPDTLRVEINGQFFTEYHFKDVPRPFFYPVIGPDDASMTRNWPVKDVPNEEHDHPHHRGLWLAHSSVNGVDCWNEGGDGRIVHTGFDEIKSGKVGVIKSHNTWVSTNGTVLCTDERTVRIYDRPNTERLLDFEVTLHASHGNVSFGDNKDGMMAIRLAETMRLLPNQFNKGKPTGHIVTSTGLHDGETWGKHADWVDYSGPVDGKIVGVAMFDDPKNPRHPTSWHVRDYGLFAANPFGKHHFENLKDEHAGDLVIPSGQSVTFRYRFYFHEGDEKQAKVAALYEEFATSK